MGKSKHISHTGVNMDPILVYCVKTDTIRQMPENYLIAHRDGGGYWICNPDIAANKKLATRVFLALFDFDTKWRSTGLELLAKVTPNIPVDKSKVTTYSSQE